MSKEQKYNLQVPINRSIEKQLREMANEMGLTLTQYCRFVLIQHTKAKCKVPGGIVPGGIVPGGIVPGGIIPEGIVPAGIVPAGVVVGEQTTTITNKEKKIKKGLGAK